MRQLIALVLVVVSFSVVADQQLPPSNIDYTGFVGMSQDVQSYRQKRLVDLDTFLQMATDPETILLDTRSKQAYDRKHLKGAVHLNFSDFTDEKLAKMIPAEDTRILIYCNNNISGDRENFFGKGARLALNIPTFINLYGYGYKNIYELVSLVPVNDPRLEFEGTDAK